MTRCGRTTVMGWSAQWCARILPRDSFDGGGVRATFFVQDTNLRRLLEAETGRLRAQLEARGLRVSELQVVTVKQSGE